MLVYGLKATVPKEFVVPNLRIAVEHKLSANESILHRLESFLKLEEDRNLNAYLAKAVQQRRKLWIQRRQKFKLFKKGEWILVYSSRVDPRPSKLNLRYVGPLQIVEVKEGESIFLLQDIEGKISPKPMNGYRLKPYYG